MNLLAFFLGLLLAFQVYPALAHEGEPPAPHDFWSSWSWEPSILISLIVAAWAYSRGVSALWQRAGFGRGLRLGQVAAFGGGWLALGVALVSPLDALSGALFSAHMLQHMLLVLIAPPLFILSGLHIAFLWALPYSFRRPLAKWWKKATGWHTVWQILTQPALVWGLFAVTFWLWHLPLLYQAAVQNELIHLLEHATFLGTAFLFWWVLLHPGHRRLDYGMGILYVFTTALQSSFLGAFLTFAPQPLYPIYSQSVGVWGLTPLQDQQLAGLIMWIPAGIFYLGAALILLVLWLRTIERNMQRRERRQAPAQASQNLR